MYAICSDHISPSGKIYPQSLGEQKHMANPLCLEILLNHLIWGSYHAPSATEIGPLKVISSDNYDIYSQNTATIV